MTSRLTDRITDRQNRQIDRQTARQTKIDKLIAELTPLNKKKRTNLCEQRKQEGTRKNEERERI